MAGSVPVSSPDSFYNASPPFYAQKKGIGTGGKIALGCIGVLLCILMFVVGAILGAITEPGFTLAEPTLEQALVATLGIPTSPAVWIPSPTASPTGTPVPTSTMTASSTPTQAPQAPAEATATVEPVIEPDAQLEAYVANVDQNLSGYSDCLSQLANLTTRMWLNPDLIFDQDWETQVLDELDDLEAYAHQMVAVDPPRDFSRAHFWLKVVEMETVALHKNFRAGIFEDDLEALDRAIKNLNYINYALDQAVRAMPQP